MTPLIVLEFVDHAKDEIRSPGAKQFSQVRNRGGGLERVSDRSSGASQLFLQVSSICNEDHLELAQRWIMINRTRHEHHGQGLARTLRVPDDAAAFLWLGFSFQSFDDLARGAILLVARDDLDRVAVSLNG